MIYTTPVLYYLLSDFIRYWELPLNLDKKVCEQIRCYFQSSRYYCKKETQLCWWTKYIMEIVSQILIARGALNKGKSHTTTLWPRSKKKGSRVFIRKLIIDNKLGRIFWNSRKTWLMWFDIWYFKNMLKNLHLILLPA